MMKKYDYIGVAKMADLEKYKFPKECKKCQIFKDNTPPKPQPKLKSCPFCGAEASLANDQGQAFWIVCGKCETNSNMFDEPEQAAKAWNKRIDNKNSQELAPLELSNP